ncbi:unnamed protein product, partial [Prorocentrum cordatum]
MVVPVSAAARHAGSEELRGAGADVTEEDVSELVLQVRASLNAGRAPRSKVDEVRRLEAALDPVAVRLAAGCQELPGPEMASALWSFTEAATVGTQAENRIRRVSADEAGWDRVADRIWAHATGEDYDAQPLDWVLHIGVGLLVACGLVALLAKSGPQAPPPGPPALPSPPWAPHAEGAGVWAAPEKPVAQDVAALRDFGKGEEVTGPFSQTAVQQLGVTSTAVPGGAPALQAHVPHAAADAVKLGQEAQMVRVTLIEFQAQAATNVYWAWHFWERTAAVDSARGLHPDLRRLLLTHGYVGAGTKSPPGGSLLQELEALVATAAAPHGGGMQAAPGWSWTPSAQQQQEDSRWNLSPPSDLKRPALEIHRSMRGAGAASARDWLSREVTGQRRTAVWTDLWTAAANVDYLLGGCRAQSEVLTRLASDDALELHLRRLASYVYELRTKDKAGAAAMAPTWLVTEATAHSEAEHRRDERVAVAGTREGRGSGRGSSFGGGSGGGDASDGFTRACGLVELMNGMDCGSLEARPRGQRVAGGDERMLAWKLVQQYALQGAARYERDCRGLAPTGGHGAELAHDRGPQGAYTGERKSVSKHVMMCASAVAEPPDDRVADLLEALLEGERQCYSDELNVLDYSGKSGVIFEELEDMRTFEAPCDVRAYCGFSCVPKEDPTKQRKVLMICASNYVWADPHQRGGHGMHGGAAMASMSAPTDVWGVAAFDEDNAFTRLRVPAWMARWQACPPLRACWVWEKLSQRIRDLVGPAGWVAPCYHRLAMGGSLSVHLLMTVNTAIIGRALLGVGARLAALQGGATPAAAAVGGAPGPSPLEDGGLEGEAQAGDAQECGQAHLYDDDWVVQQSSCREGHPNLEGYSVAEWIEAVKAAKREDERVLVVMRFPRWDLANPATFSALVELCEGGWVDIVLGGPPCSTWSRARYSRRQPGTPPVRSRLCPWGLPGLSAWEAERVAESSTLTLNLLALCEACGQSGGAFLIEHPEDPGREPYPSIWNTKEVLDFERRRSSQRARLDQCMLGGRTKKPTCLSGALQGVEALSELRCDGPRTHESAEGKLADGAFRTSPLAQYLEAMCETPGSMIVEACFEKSGLGGTGWRRPPEADRAVTVWGTRSTTAPAVAARSEDVLRGRGLVLDGPQMAFYLHVDDGVVMAGGQDGGSRATSMMHQLADALAEAGFVVTDRTEASDMRKVLGYAPQARPAQLRLPPARARELVQQLELMSGARSVDTEELRSLLGVWIWGALLRREVLCPPSAVFRLLERYPRQRVSTWATVRRELRAMAKVVPLMYADLGAPPAPVYFAADAMGANAEDDGGWGVLVTDIRREIAQDFIDTGGSLGYTVARLDGDLTGLRRPEQMIKRTKPFSLLPDRVFTPDEDWTIVGQGRWRSADHITLGEARCVVKISRLAAASPALRRAVLPILEDNQPVSGAVNKGRQFEAALGLDIHWAPHSARAGFASDSVARGIPFQEIKEAGRWLTEPSLRIYVGVVTASRVLAQAEQRGIASLVREAAEKLPSYFPKGIFGEGACGKHAADGLAQGAPDLGELMGGILAGVTWAAVAVWLISWMYASGPMAHFGTMMGVAASVSVSAGKVVDHGLGAVITAAQGVSDFAVTSTRHSANILQEAWRGIDITDLRVHQRHAERIADDPSLLQEWVVREFLSVEPRPPGADQVANALAEASVRLPHATESWQMLVWPGQYRELHMTCDLLSTGFYGVHVVDRIVNFSVQWSNPLWSGLECDLGAERDTVRLHINSTLSRPPLPAIRYMSMSDRELELAKLPG